MAKLEMFPYVNTTKQSDQTRPRPKHNNDEDDGYLHFQSRDPYETIDSSNNMDTHTYSSIKEPTTNTKMSGRQLGKDDNTKAKHSSILSRKCLALIGLLIISSGASAVIAGFYTMKNVCEKCDCTRLNLNDENGSSVTPNNSSLTTPPTITTTTTYAPIITTPNKSSLTTPPTTTITTTYIPTSTISIEEVCTNTSLLIPHPEMCNAFYNCSYTFHSHLHPRYYDECSYPDQFDADTLTCKDWRNVSCGTRKEAKNGCDYRFLGCYGHCSPCDWRYPSCEGLKDGLHPRPEAEWSPFYIRCYDERLISIGECKTDYRGMRELFHAITKTCESQDRIPQEHGGMMPNCTGKEYGTYPNEFGMCFRYTICGGGEYIDYVDCPSGQAYDEVSKTCSSQPNTCICSGSTDCETDGLL